VLQCVAVRCRACCSLFAMCCTVHCGVLPCVAVCCRVLQCVTLCCKVCCSMLQCVVVCYSVIQCIASSIIPPCALSSFLCPPSFMLLLLPRIYSSSTYFADPNSCSTLMASLLSYCLAWSRGVSLRCSMCKHEGMSSLDTKA